MSVAQYSLLLLNPSIERLDTVVFGAMFRTNVWDVRVTTSVSKIMAVNPAYPESKLLQTVALVKELAANKSTLQDVRVGFEGGRWGVFVDKFVGSFTHASDAEYQSQVAAVLAESVNPPLFAQSHPIPVSRRRNVVRRNLREHFKARGLWSKHDSDIDQHKIVEHYPISPESGVIAEFALRNGVMHITETVDFEVQSLQGKRLLAQAKTLVLSESARVFGASTKRYVVVAGSTREDARQSMNLLRDHAEVFALESTADMTTYVDAISIAAGSTQQPLA